MGTTKSFQEMINEYIRGDILREELIKRDWFLSQLSANDAIDMSWKEGNIPVPFVGAQASSVKMGGLTSASDVAKHKYVRGNITSPKEAWGTLRFEHHDLMIHDKVSEQNFLKVLPGQIEDFAQVQKEQLSTMLMSGPVCVTATDDVGAASGVFKVDKIERLMIGQKLQIIDGNSAQADVYVIAINLNTNEATFSLTRGGAAANLSAYTVAQAAKFYFDGVLVGGVVTNAFTNLRDSLLSAANGGTANLHGVSKLAYPYLQAINVSGAAISATNLKAKLFDAYNEVRKKARGNASSVVMSFKHLGTLMAQLEDQKGAFKVTARDEKASIYGWTEITITSVKGTLKVIGVQEMSDDVIFFLDMTAFKFFTNGEMMKKRTAPDGKQYFEVREESGFYYLLDIATIGEFALLAPGKCGIIHSIPNY